MMEEQKKTERRQKEDRERSDGRMEGKREGSEEKCKRQQRGEAGEKREGSSGRAPLDVFEHSSLVRKKSSAIGWTGPGLLACSCWGRVRGCYKK